MTGETPPAAKSVTDALREAIKFLGWVSDSYLAHAKVTDVIDEQIAYEGSAEMAREQAAALAALSLPAPEPVMYVSPWQFANRANFDSDYMPFRLKVEGLFTQPLYAAPLPAIDDAELLEATEREVKRMLADPAPLPAPGGGAAPPVAWLKPSDIERLAKMQGGAINAQIANLSFVGCTVPVFSTPAAPELGAVKDGWVPIETAPKGKKVIAGYRNRLGNWRSIMARYYLPSSLDNHDIDSEDEYAPEGWYEESETHETILPTEHQPTHWMPIAASPQQGEKL